VESVGSSSTIEWTDATWNPVTGCTKISPGCKFCYAERLATRLRAMGNPRYTNGFQVTLHADQLDLPRRWRRPRRIFVNSMSDLFHEDVPLEYVDRVFDVMREATHHVYQVLTKRADRLVLWHRGRPHVARIPDHVWIGVSVESRAYAWRVERLRQVAATVRFISAEPLLGSLGGLDLSGIGWVIAGGESGGPLGRALVQPGPSGWGPKPTSVDWVRELRDACLDAKVPFFFKQWGGRTPAANGRTLDGEEWSRQPIAASRLS
jgi:protein gp37